MNVKTLTIIILSLFLQLGALPTLAQAPLGEIEPNDSITTAQNLESATWSLEADSNITSSTTLPHVTIAGSGDSSFDYYVFRVSKAGSKGIFDIDSTTGGFDSYLTLYNSSGAQLDSNDDSGVNQGAGGSKTSLDSYLEYTFPASGLYIIRVGARIGGSSTIVPIPAGMSYRLQISVKDHLTGWKIYLPGILLNPPSSAPIPSPTSVPPTPTPTSQPTNVNIPCLLVLGQRFDIYGAFDILAGCVSGSSATTWRYDPLTGAINGFDFIVKNQFGDVIYEASIDLQRDQYGRVGGYAGTVSGTGFTSFTETIVNEYNQYGRIIGADVTKTYITPDESYAMDLTPCWLGDRWSGYQVAIDNGQTATIGNCS